MALWFVTLSEAKIRGEIIHLLPIISPNLLVIMIKHFASILVLCVLALSARGMTEQEVVNQSAGIIRDFRHMPEQSIPATVLDEARGLAIIRVLKIGFVFSGKGGQGVVIAKTGNGWSGPSFIGTGGAGFGF